MLSPLSTSTKFIKQINSLYSLINFLKQVLLSSQLQQKLIKQINSFKALLSLFLFTEN